MLTIEVESCVDGTPSFEIDRNEQDEYKQMLQRSSPSVLKYTKDLVASMEIYGKYPPDKGMDRYCDCFEIESFENEDDTKEEEKTAV